ncbi:MAG: efflux RND transporter permease subunit, partial [Leptodesmis sp.]|uniref:efflux RND transporter permease subunit n=1 Tax=Leptodesmis sp. TaxID=3100501 RepID=UPI003D0FEA47
ITTSDIISAIREQNAQFAAGKIGAQPTSKQVDFTFTVNTQGRLKTAEDFGNIIIKASADFDDANYPGSNLQGSESLIHRLNCLIHFCGIHN